MRVLLADAHLVPSRADAAARATLIGFLDHLPPGTHELYLLGDIFEFWFEYRAVIPKHFLGVLAALGRLVAGGVPVWYVPGNHDYWLGRALTEELGIRVTPPVFRTTLDGRRALLAHGDTLVSTAGSRLLRAVMRSRLDIELFALLHPDAGVALARLVAALSRRIQSVDFHGPALAAAARRELERGTDLVVCAHSHQPRCVRLGGGWYLNVGSWREKGSYGVVRDGVPELGRFDAPTRTWSGPSTIISSP